MLLSDVEIREAMKAGRIVIEPFYEANLQPASYHLRVGKRMLVSGEVEEIDMEQKRSIALKAGQFALLTSLERITLANDMGMILHCSRISYAGGSAQRR